MSAPDGMAPWPRPWRILFAIELPLVLGTIAFWTVAPETYLEDTVGIASPGPAEVFLLRLYAGTVASLVFGFYAWLLGRPAVHVPTFHAFQVCLGLGDVFIIAASLAHLSATTRPAMLGAQIGMAALWGILRVVYLSRRGPT